jgi:hypothetical protein
MSQRTEYLLIQLFSYLGHPKNQIFGYLVIWLFGYPGQPNNYQIFGYSGHPKKTEETEFGKP